MSQILCKISHSLSSQLNSSRRNCPPATSYPPPTTNVFNSSVIMLSVANDFRSCAAVSTGPFCWFCSTSEFIIPSSIFCAIPFSFCPPPPPSSFSSFSSSLHFSSSLSSSSLPILLNGVDQSIWIHPISTLSAKTFFLLWPALVLPFSIQVYLPNFRINFRFLRLFGRAIVKGHPKPGGDTRRTNGHSQSESRAVARQYSLWPRYVVSSLEIVRCWWLKCPRWPTFDESEKALNYKIFI